MKAASPQGVSRPRRGMLSDRGRPQHPVDGRRALRQQLLPHVGIEAVATRPSSPKACNWAGVSVMTEARYFPHGSPINVHTSIKTFRAS